MKCRQQQQQQNAHKYCVYFMHDTKMTMRIELISICCLPVSFQLMKWRLALASNQWSCCLYKLRSIFATRLTMNDCFFYFYFFFYYCCSKCTIANTQTQYKHFCLSHTFQDMIRFDILFVVLIHSKIPRAQEIHKKTHTYRRYTKHSHEQIIYF